MLLLLVYLKLIIVLFDLILFQGLKFVEDWHDHEWDQDHQEKYPDCQENARVQVEVLTGRVDDPEEPVEQRRQKNHLKYEAFRPILQPAAQGLLVEAVRFLDHELFYQRAWPIADNRHYLEN